MASLRTLNKRLNERRTWTVTTLASDGKWYQRAYNTAVTSGKVQRVRIPGKRERELLRALAKAQSPLAESDAGRDVVQASLSTVDAHGYCRGCGRRGNLSCRNGDACVANVAEQDRQRAVYDENASEEPKP